MIDSAMREAFERGSRSVMSLPFRKEFYREIEVKSISSEELIKKNDWEKFVFAPFGINRAEEHFKWMIKLGILRREVDGQGLTNRVKLTTLGKKIVDQWNGEIPRAGIRERIIENFHRHRPRL